jgi:EmrB/QacA subfamily drug resistance transporter
MSRRDDISLRRTATVVAALSSFLSPFMSSSVNIALPAIGQEFSLDTVLLGWVTSAYLLSAAMCLVPFGKIADIHGRKRIFTYGIGFYTLASLLCALSTSGAMLIVSRALQGIGSAMVFGTGVAILTSVFPPGERGRVLGMNVAATYAGLSLGPVLGGFLTQGLGWRSLFLVNVPLGLIVVALVLWGLKGEWAGAAGEAFDWIGSVVCGMSLVAMMYGLSLLPEMKGVWMLLGGVVGVAAFGWWETKTDSPILNVSLFGSNRVFVFSNLAALIHYSATFAIGFLLSLYLQYIKALSPQSAGLVLVVQPVMMAVFSPLMGRLSDRIEAQTLASAGMGLMVVALLLLASLGPGTSLGLIVAYQAILGFGYALFSSPNVNAVMSSVEKRFFGIASATLGTMRLTGQMLSMGVATLILAITIGKVQITPQYYGAFLISLRTAFLLFAVLCFGGVFASLARGKMRPSA